jgi:hypothetical protein
MKKIFEKVVGKYAVCAVLMLQLFYVANINAAQNENLQLEIGAGKPAISPNVAVIDEEVAVNFKVWVIDTVTRKEVTPLNVKQYNYKLECPSGTITKTVPTMTIATDKHSATLTDTKLLPDIKQSAKFTTKGKLKSTLNVEIVFNDNSSLSKSYSIEVEIVDATVTVYAQKPDKVVERPDDTGKMVLYYVLMKDAIHQYDDPVGHSFWRCFVDDNISLTSAQKALSGKKFGLYPQHPTGNDKDVPGIIKDDDSHSYAASRTFSITVDNAKKLIDKTISTKNLPNLQYNIIAKSADNCTSLSVKMCNDAGGSSPDGKGVIGAILYESVPGSIMLPPSSVPNPYHHVIQIKKLE